MKTPEEILYSKGVQFPASRSPRDYNLVLIAMYEYASQQSASLVEENERLNKVVETSKKWYYEKEEENKKLRQALSELIDLDKRNNLACDVMNDSQGTIDAFPAPVEWRTAFQKAKSLLFPTTKEEKV